MSILAEIDRRKRIRQMSQAEVGAIADETTLSDVAALPFDLAGKALQALSYPSDVTRAAIGRLSGIEGSGTETFLGTAPTGRELLGLGEGELGRVEASDIPAALTVGVLDPLLFLPAGKLSKVGELAKRAGTLERSAGAYKAAGEAQKALGELRALRGVQSSLRAAGAPGRTRLADTLGNQARAGQRNLMTLSIPGLPDVPLVRGAGALDVLGKAGGAVGRALSPAYEKLFKPEGRISVRQAEGAASSLGRSASDIAEEVGMQSDVAKETIRFGRHVADQEAARIARFSVGRDDSGAAAAFRQAVAPEIQAGYAAASSYFDPKISDAVSRGFMAKAKQLGRDKADEFRKLDKLAGFDVGPKTQKLLNIAVESADTRQKVGKTVGKLVRERDAELSKLNSRIATTMAAPASPRSLSLLGRLQAKATQTQQDFAGKIAKEVAYGKIAKAGLREIPADIREEAKRIAFANGNTLAVVRAAGAPGPELSDRYISYLGRMAEPTGLKLLEGLKGKIPAAFEKVVANNRAGGGSAIERVPEFEGLGVSQINDWFREALRQAGAPNVTDDVRLFAENPAEIMLRKLTSDYKRAANAKLQQGTISMFGVPENAKRFGDIPLAEYIQSGRLANFTTQALPAAAVGGSRDEIQAALKSVGMDNMFIPKEIAAETLKVSEILDDPEQLKGMLGFIDKYHQLGRFGVTQLFPAFHSRNAMSNGVMMWLGGMRDPTWLARAGSLQAKAAGEGPLAKLARGITQAPPLTVPERALLDRARELGVIGTGQSDEIRRLQYTSGKDLFEKRIAPVTQKLSKVGATIEDNAKLAMFMEGRANGMSDVEAANRVKKYLFDYTDLSRVEKHYLRRWAYFYTYSRKSMPLIMSELAKSPYVGSTYNRLTGEYEGSPQRDMMPEWMRNQGMLYLGEDDQGQQSFASLDLPFSQLYDYSSEGKGVGRSVQKLAGSLAPIPKALFEVGSGTNLRSGKPRQGGLGDILTASLPTNRFQSTFGRAADIVAGAENAPNISDFALSMAGLPGIRRLNPADARGRLERDRMELALEKLAQSGRARRRLGYTPIGDDEDVRSLNSGLSRLSRR